MPHLGPDSLEGMYRSDLGRYDEGREARAEMKDDTPPTSQDEDDDILDIRPSEPSKRKLTAIPPGTRRVPAPTVQAKQTPPQAPQPAQEASQAPQRREVTPPNPKPPQAISGEVVDIRRPLIWRGERISWDDPDIVAALKRSEQERARNLPAYEFYKGEWFLPGMARRRREEDAQAVREGREPRLDVHVQSALEARDRALRPIGEAIAGRYDSPDQARCPICQGDRAARLRLEDDLQQPDPDDLLTLAARHRFKPSEIAAHAAKCFGSVPAAMASTKAVEARMSSLEAFGLELVEGVRSALANADAVLTALAKEKATVDVAKGFISLAKARAQVLDGALARAERKRVLDALERAETAPTSLQATGSGGSVVALPARSQRLAEAIARRQARRIVDEPEPTVIDNDQDDSDG